MNVGTIGPDEKDPFKIVNVIRQIIGGLSPATLTAVDKADTILGGDTSAGLPAQFTVENLFKALTTLTEDTAPDGAADFLLTYDASAGTVKKVLLQRSTAFKVGVFNRDVSLSSGTQAVTGIGFKPKALILFANINSTSATSWGMDDISSSRTFFASTTSWVFASNSVSIYLDVSGGNNYAGSATSFDSDGFTITWTKTGTPTGTVSVNYLALR